MSNTDTTQATTPTGDEILQQVLQMQKDQAEQLKTLQRENAALKTKLAGVGGDSQPAQKPEIPKETFEVGGKQWRFVAASFRMPTPEGPVMMTAVDALADRKVLEGLVWAKSGVVVEVA